MNERIHRHLDGELPIEALTSDERRELAVYEEALRRTAAVAANEPVPDVTNTVMERIAREAPSKASVPESAGTSLLRSVAGLGGWLWAPRPVRLRPAYGVAVAAMVVAFAMAFPGDTPVPAPQATVSAPEVGAAQVFVQFRFDAPEASTVHLAGTFTGWEPAYALHETAPGVWSLLVPLDPGVHEYSFIVDGREWTPDPTGPRVSDGFGGENSRVTVVFPNGRSL